MSCPPVCNDIVTPRHLFPLPSVRQSATCTDSSFNISHNHLVEAMVVIGRGGVAGSVVGVGGIDGDVDEDAIFVSPVRASRK